MGLSLSKAWKEIDCILGVRVILAEHERASMIKG